MPQVGSSLLNKTIRASGQTFNNRDSLFIQLNNLEKGTEVKLYGIAWGICGASTNALQNLNTASLQILRNEIFNTNLTYGTQAVVNDRDVVFEDVMPYNRVFQYLDFSEPIKLRGAADWLIIFPAPINLADGNAPYDCSLTVRGDIIGTDLQSMLR